MTTLFAELDEKVDSVAGPPPPDSWTAFRCADFFCGIGGFHVAARNLGLKVVWASDIDEDARRAYLANYGLQPEGDIVSIMPENVPSHDLLFAGFPCQPFSIIGRQQGFSDPRGTLFFEVLRFVRVHRPMGIVLENVKQLYTASAGAVLLRIKAELGELGYDVDAKVLNALDFGLPQKRERTFIVASLASFDEFPWPEDKVPMKPLAEVLETNPDPKYYVSATIREKRHREHTATVSPAVWHENKGGHVSSHEWSCALRAEASHNYLLVDGERRLTSRELLRLQGFPESWDIVCNDGKTRRQAGNAVPVPMVQAVIDGMVRVLARRSYNSG